MFLFSIQNPWWTQTNLCSIASQFIFFSKLTGVYCWQHIVDTTHCNPGQDKVVTEDDWWMNEWSLCIFMLESSLSFIKHKVSEARLHPCYILTHHQNHLFKTHTSIKFNFKKKYMRRQLHTPLSQDSCTNSRPLFCDCSYNMGSL